MTCIAHEPCPKCGSKDNLARYADGGAHCFTGTCKHWEPADSGYVAPAGGTGNATKSAKLPQLGDYLPLNARGISSETCTKMRYSVGSYFVKNKESGDWQPKTAQIVHVTDQDGKPVAAKVRMAGKDFRYVGDTKAAGLIFQNLWPAGGLKLVICEGEIDALSVSQVQGNKYPVVSLPNGVDSAMDVCGRSRDYINSFKEVILMLDQDEAGAACAKELTTLFPSAKIASLPLKDPNEMLQAGRGKEIINAIFNAQAWSPDGIIKLSSLKDAMSKPVEWGLPWGMPSLNALTYGRRAGELYFIGAGTGIGKTDWCLQQIVEDAKLGEKTALFLLEQPVVETGKRLAGKLVGKMFHLPPDAGNYTQDDLDSAVDDLINLYDVDLYDHFGGKDWEAISDNIRWLATQGVKHFWVDHITALVAHAEDERRAIEAMTEEMSSLCQECGINLYVVSHLATPEGKPHEEGGRVMARHFKGSRSIAQWGHYMIGFERNTQAEDSFVKTVTTLRVVKDRYTGQATGSTILLGYDTERGLQYELTPAEVERYNGASSGGNKSTDYGGEF